MVDINFADMNAEVLTANTVTISACVLGLIDNRMTITCLMTATDAILTQ